MIISASRRTDIPSCYPDWFLNRIREGFVLVRNPMNFRQVSKIRLTPDVVDGIVFWTKNPAPILSMVFENVISQMSVLFRENVTLSDLGFVWCRMSELTYEQQTVVVGLGG